MTGLFNLGPRNELQNNLPDHRIIALNIHKKNEKKRCPSYWKLNFSIVQNKDYKNRIYFFWQKWQQRKQEYRDPAAWLYNGKKVYSRFNQRF